MTPRSKASILRRLPTLHGGQLRKDLTLSHFRSEARRLGSKWSRRLRRVDRQVVSLEPEGEVRGSVLLSYILDPFLLGDDPAQVEARMPRTHTHFWEAWTMARTFLEMGRRVDAISWTNGAFEPERAYEVVIDVRLNLERWAPRLPAETLRVLHIDTGHYSFHNPAQRRRLDAVAARRGVPLRGHKLLPENRAIESAQVATVMGDRFTQGTYAFAGRPLLHVPISVPHIYPWIEGKDFASASRRFVWFGSGALVHKGLDLVLEAFAGMPELHLTVCGPVRRERDFERAYFRELYETPNIHTYGWIDVGSPAFLELARSTLGLVYPSCSEGGGGSVYTCMHAGLVPMTTFETSVPIDPAWGIALEDPSVDGIRRAVRALSRRPPAELERMARAARAAARRENTQEGFRAGYRQAAARLLDGSWRDVAPPAAPDSATATFAPGHAR
ncbi:MAG: glycosyltransferase [Acidobacteriota bacterium]